VLQAFSPDAGGELITPRPSERASSSVECLHAEGIGMPRVPWVEGVSSSRKSSTDYHPLPVGADAGHMGGVLAAPQCRAYSPRGEHEGERERGGADREKVVPEDNVQLGHVGHVLLAILQEL
jgi:hypothetical protein